MQTAGLLNVVNVNVTPFAETGGAGVVAGDDSDEWLAGTAGAGAGRSKKPSGARGDGDNKKKKGKKKKKKK